MSIYSGGISGRYPIFCLVFLGSSNISLPSTVTVPDVEDM